MQNYDEAILRRRRINLNAPYPVNHQAVRIAMYDEYAARAFYSLVVNAFGDRMPFTSIIQSEDQHIAALSKQCERLGIPRPIDPFPIETRIEPTWLANCERAIAGEIFNVQLYQTLLTQISDSRIITVFQNLQATSFQNHLPAFRQATAEAIAQERYHAARGIPPQQAYEKHDPLTDLVEKAFAQFASAGTLGLFSPILRQAHPAMLAGVATGGAAVYFLRKKFNRKQQEN